MNKYHKTIDRLTIIGPMDEKDTALDYCYDNVYRVVRSGPKRIGGNKVDMEKFKIIAEKELLSDGTISINQARKLKGLGPIPELKDYQK